MKLDELSRLSASVVDDPSVEKWERLRRKVEEQGLNWGKLYQELEMSHRYVDAYQHESLEGGHVPLHSHSFYELLYCRNSCGMEYLIGPERYRLQGGDLVFVPPGCYHQPLLTDHLVEPCRREVVWMSREFMAQLRGFGLPAAMDWSQPFLLRTADTPWEELGERIQTSVWEALGRAPGWEAFVAGNTMILLTLLARVLNQQDGGSLLGRAEEPELLEQLFAYIEAHLGEPITLEETARHFWVSESKISQTFRKKLGISFYRCVTQRRLMAAKVLILEGVPLNEVNVRVGFADYSTFFRAFKREYGIAPSQFRSLLAGRGGAPRGPLAGS